MKLSMQSAYPLVFLLAVVYSQSDIRKPPSIIFPRWPETQYHAMHSEVVLKCTAEGTPQPRYQWLFNGSIVSESQYVSLNADTGDLILRQFSRYEEGTYRCLASNVFSSGPGTRVTATSMSPPIVLHQIKIGRFQKTEDTEITVTEYSYVKLPCDNKGEIIGTDAVYMWMFKDEYGYPNVSLREGDRVFIDQEGSLHFSYVLQTDSMHKIFCAVSSVVEGLIVVGNSINLTVHPVSNPQPITPRLQYSNTVVKALRFSQARLECVFSGYDLVEPHVPVTRWYDDIGREITRTNPKYTLSADDQILYVNTVDEVDEGNYYCEAENSAGKSGKSPVFLDVTSAPIFTMPDGAPRDQVVPEGRDVVFHCDARSASAETEPATPVWFINGQKFVKYTDPSKFVFSDDKKELTIKSVKKATDIMCVQCAVRNHVGTTWGNACLNVILPITLVKVPDLRQEISHGDYVDLTVEAVTDPAMRLEYEWKFRNESYQGYQFPPYVSFNPVTNRAYIDTSLLTAEEFDAIGGRYERVIYNMYELMIVNIEVVLRSNQSTPSISNSTNNRNNTSLGNTTTESTTIPTISTESLKTTTGSASCQAARNICVDEFITVLQEKELDCQALSKYILCLFFSPCARSEIMNEQGIQGLMETYSQLCGV